MRPKQTCIATAIYAPGAAAGSRSRSGAVTRPPSVRLCEHWIAWQFVQSAHVSSFLSERRTFVGAEEPARMTLAH